MNIAVLKTATSRVLHKGLFKTRKYAPEILVVTGVVGMITTVVLASKATLKLEQAIWEGEQAVDDVKQHADTNDLSEREEARALTKVYVKNAYRVGKLYFPAVMTGVGSISCVLGAHGIMRSRNVALVAAYNVLDRSYAAYRERVGLEVGEDKERDIRIGVTEQKIKDEETGKTSTLASVDPNTPSMYARFFEKGSTRHWEPSSAYNRAFILAQEQYANDILLARGHVFLNDIYDALGFERTREGSVVGWVISKEGDNYIDFGVHDFADERKRAFQNGMENSIFLDFNVDGVIWDKI